MDFAYFLNILLKRKWLILSTMILAGATAWYFVGKLPPTFKSSATISAGIFEFKGLTLNDENAFIQQYEIDARFNQLIKDMTSRKSIRKVTNKLIEHDIKNIVDPGLTEAEPFRLPDEEILNIPDSQLDDFALVLKTNFQDTLLGDFPDYERLNPLISEAFGYDYESLMEDMVIVREGDTDYVTVAFESERADLSYFVVETYCKEFLNFTKQLVTKKEDEQVRFYSNLVNEKKSALDSIVNRINQYKTNNNLIDVGTQSESAIATIQTFQDKREKEYQKIIPLRANLKYLDEKIRKYNRSFSAAYSDDLFRREDFVDINKEISDLQLKLNQARTGKEAIQKKIKKLENLKAELISQFAKSNIHNDHPIHDQVKEWISEKAKSEYELEFAKEAVASYDRELRNLGGKIQKYQKDDAELANMEAHKENVEKQYEQNLYKLEEAKLKAASIENPLSIEEYPEKADKPEPSHRSVIAAFSGIAGGTFASIFIFILALLDTTIQSPSQFSRRTKLPLLGFVNRIKTKKLDLNFLFHSNNPKGQLVTFRESIRKLRSIVEASGKRSFLFVSPKDGEGKSFLIILLAYALSLNNKRVLIIDTNFRNNTLSNYKNSPFWANTGDGKGGLVSNWLGSGSKEQVPTEGAEGTGWNLRNVDIIGNKNGQQSPSEVLAGKDFDRVMRNYSTRYDYIFLEAASMNKYSDALELMPYVDKVISVFSAGSQINNSDKETMNLLRQFDNKFLGGILNQVDLKNL